MSQSMLSESDTTLDTRRRSLRHKPKEIHRCTAMDDTQIKLEDAQTKFCTEIHSLLQEAVEQLMTPLIFNCHITMAEPAVTLADVAYCS
jgi:hypothetical protein